MVIARVCVCARDRVKGLQALYLSDPHEKEKAASRFTCRHRRRRWWCNRLLQCHRAHSIISFLLRYNYSHRIIISNINCSIIIIVFSLCCKTNPRCLVEFSSHNNRHTNTGIDCVMGSSSLSRYVFSHIKYKVLNIYIILKDSFWKRRVGHVQSSHNI